MDKINKKAIVEAAKGDDTSWFLMNAYRLNRAQRDLYLSTLEDQLAYFRANPPEFQEMQDLRIALNRLKWRLWTECEKLIPVK